MKNITTRLKTHLQQKVTTLAICWQVILNDGVNLGFTNHDEDLYIDDLIYKAGTGFTSSAVTSYSSLAIDNLAIEGALSSELITEQDILNGRYDFAKIVIFMVNYRMPRDKLLVKQGTLGKVTLKNGKFIAEINGISASIKQNVGELYSSLCRAKFCDNRCKLNAQKFTFTGTITTVLNQREFIDSNLKKADNYFDYGVITFTSGANKNSTIEVKESLANGRISLVMSMTNTMRKGDSYTLLAGCDKRFSTCCNKFNNSENFRGEPHIPDNNLLYKTT